MRVVTYIGEEDHEQDSSRVWRSLSIPLVMSTTPDVVAGGPTPSRTPPTATMESITGLDDTLEFMDAQEDVTPPINTEVDCAIASPTDSPLSSNSGTLKARKYKQKDSSNSPRGDKKCPSPKVPYSMRKESSLPQVKADTVKVMEMFLKRRSKSLNDAVLTKEYFEREKRRKKSRPVRNTVTVVQSREIREETSETSDTTEVKLRDKSERTCLPRGHESYVWAMENRLEVGYSGTDNIADDELSSPEEGKSRSAPSTLRLHVQRVSEAEVETLENTSLTLTRDPQRKDRKDVKRKKSILEKAKRIIRSPSTQRKTIVADHDSYSPSYAKDEVHSEMKKTGFTSRLKRTFSRKDTKKSKEEPSPRDSPINAERNKSLERNKSMEKRSSLDRKKASEDSKNAERNKSLNRSESKERHTRRWPFKRRSRKSIPTPTDESAAGASDSASMRDWASSSDISSNYTLSLNETERRKMLIDIRRGIHLRSSGNFSDSQVMYAQGPRSTRPRSVPHALRESNGSLASSEGSDRRTSRPTSLIFRERRAERSRRGLNDVMNLDSTTPGHIRRNVQTRELEYSMSLSMASDLEAQGLEEGSREQSEDNVEEEGPSRRVSRASLGSSWTSSTWEESGASGSDVPFDQRSVDEQEEFFKRIADRLAQIGDQVVQEYHFESDGRGEEPPGPSQTKASILAESRSFYANGTSSGGASGSTSDLNDAIGSRIRSTVDGVSRGRNQHIPREVIRRVIFDTAYTTFQEAVQSLINRNPGMEEISQLALVFHFTKQACKLAQAFGKKANSIKENSINYIGYRFAAWIDSQGGWGVVVESDSEDSVHESEID